MQDVFPIDATAPSNDEIAQCARELWIVSGCPAGHDEAIWYEAERRLLAARRASLAPALILPLRRSLRNKHRNGRAHLGFRSLP